MTSQDDDFDLDALKATATAATPRPDAALRAAHLRLAQENFAQHQGSRVAPRLTSDRSIRGVWQGVSAMLNTITSRGGLTITTALVACGFLFLTPQGQGLWQGQGVRGEGDPVEEPVLDPVVEPVVNPATDPVQPDLTEGQTAPEGVTDQAALTGAETLPQVTDGTAVEAQDTGAATETAELEPGEQEEGGLAAIVVEPAPVELMPELAIVDNQRAQPGSPDAMSGALADAEPMAEMAAPAAAAPLDQALRGIAADGFSQDVGRVETTTTRTGPDTEAFATALENGLMVVADTPVSTFSIDVDTASYAIVRQSLNAGQLPPEDAVRIEELVNYFPYDYAAPGAGEGPFRPTVTVTDTPWNTDTDLVHISIQGMMPALEDRPPLNLVFLIDTSGSMDEPAKLPLLKQSFLLMLDELRPEDSVAIVTYAGSAGLVLPPTPASDRAAILAAMQTLAAGGSTNGQGGLEQAYATAEAMMAEGEVSRVILATDGDFNVGLSGVTELTDYIADKRDTGVFLSVLGFGRGNLDDATMQALAQNGNGTAAYIDTLNEAQKVLVDQLTGALFAIASDVKIQVEFNPAVIAEYRLIGYETRALAREDFNNDAVDAGELGAGHTVTAIYEVTPVGSPAQMTTPLRYGEVEAVVDPASVNTTELGFLRLRWKAPGADDSVLLETPILRDGPDATAAHMVEVNYGVAMAAFGQLLRDNPALGGWGWDEAIALAAANRGADDFGYRNEAVRLMRLAQSLSE